MTGPAATEDGGAPAGGRGSSAPKSKSKAKAKAKAKAKPRKAKATVFEWGGGRFSDRAGLEDLLAKGYFREGVAWGAVRSGWEQAARWEQVWEWLAQAAGGRMFACTGAMAGSPAGRRAPKELMQGAGGPGAELWSAGHPGAFLSAAGPMWAACEAWELGEAAPPAATKSGSGRGGRL